MKKLFLISLLVLFIQVTFGQTKTITGTVKTRRTGFLYLELVSLFRELKQVRLPTLTETTVSLPHQGKA